MLIEKGEEEKIKKALEHWHRAAELGCAEAYGNIGNVYNDGIGVKVDKKKASRYYELAAIGGSEVARYNLGYEEEKAIWREH